MADTSWITVGMRVCVSGYGESALVHEHTTIERLTKTLVVCENGRRYRIGSLSSVPYQPYAGTDIHPTCKRKVT